VPLGRAGRAGTVNGVRTIAFCTDGTSWCAMGTEGCAHIVNAYDTRSRSRAPSWPLALRWCAAGRGVKALHAGRLVFEAMIRASGYVPQISVVVGFRRRRAAYGPALTDVVVMAPEGRVFVTGPDIVRSVTGETSTWRRSAARTPSQEVRGVPHRRRQRTRRLRARPPAGRLFCQQGHFDRSKAESGDTDLHAFAAGFGAARLRRAPLVEALLDGDAPFEELQGKWLRRSSSASVGCRAEASADPNNPLRLGGCPELRKRGEGSAFRAAVRRVRDSAGGHRRRAGYLPGVDQEWGGVVRAAPSCCTRSASARSRAQLVTRKIYGGAYIAMNSRSLQRHQGVRWPDAEVAVMGAKAASASCTRRRLAAAPDRERDALHDDLAAEHERIAGVWIPPSRSAWVDEKINPAQHAQQADAGVPRRPRAAAAQEHPAVSSPRMATCDTRLAKCRASGGIRASNGRC